MTKDQKLHDSGERRTFKGGAVRDRGDLKPRPDLISPHAQMREGMIMTLGGQKYELRNWEKGMPISEFLASAQRHIEKCKLGETDEDHIAQARWNLGAAIHCEEEIKAGRMDPEFDDMPKYVQRTPMPPYPMYPTVRVMRNVGDSTIEPGDPVVLDGPQPAQLVTQFGWNGKISYDSPPTFYIAGPMRGIPGLNFPLFDAVTKQAQAQGLSVVSPAEMDREHGIDPDATGCLPTPCIEEIVRRDCEVILNLQKDRGDGLILLPGWDKSIGARAEVALALWLELKFKYAYEHGLDDKIPEWVENMLFCQFGPASTGRAY